ncbi:transglutaminase domain-containing protein [Palleronia sp. KMU-117]|uniref:transglutaminase domain-containing protein n=1 Tax=Palleronia sp. KMU-117 TaxID=3434108 RepID=UPI003D75BF22
MARSMMAQASSFLIAAAGAISILLTPAAALADSLAGSWMRTAGGAIPQGPTARDLAPPADAYAGVLDSILAMIDTYDRTVPSPDQLADRFGTDAEAAFRFVRDTIRTDPYSGTLRAPEAVIAASGGNPQDKSELLMTLLRKMGFDARIATAPMNDAIAARLGASACAVTPAPDPHLHALMGMTPQTMRRAIARAQRDYGLLTQAALGDVAAAGSVSRDFGPTHAWVQYRSSDGWRDLDPSVAGLSPGEALATATGLSEGGEDPHTVTLTVVTETLADGQLRERRVLTHDLRARDVTNTPIQLAFVPENAGQGGVLADKLGAVVDRAPRMKPALMIDWDVVLGDDMAQPGRMSGGGLAGGEAEEPVTAVYLDITSVATGGQTRTARRALIDLLPVAARGGDAIAADAIRAPAMGVRHPQELEGAVQVIVSNGGLDPADHAARLLLIATSADDITTRMTDGTILPDSLIWFAWTAAHGLATGAERALRDAVSQQGDICTFAGHPNVMLSGIAPRGDSGVATWIDWAIDGVDLASASAAPDPGETAALRLWYGAVRGAIETEALQPYADSTLGSSDQRLVSASTVLTGPLTRLSEAEVAQLGAPDAMADQAAGFALYGAGGLVPDPPVWWRVNLQSGAADARVAGMGNFSFWWSGNYVNAANKASVTQIGEIYAQYERGEISKRTLNAKLKAESARARVRASGRAKTMPGQSRGGSNEYLVTLTVAVVAGTTLATIAGLIVYTHFYAALFGPP